MARPATGAKRRIGAGSMAAATCSPSPPLPTPHGTEAPRRGGQRGSSSGIGLRGHGSSPRVSRLLDIARCVRARSVVAMAARNGGEMGRRKRSHSLSVTSSATPSSDATKLDFAAADVACPFGRVDALGPIELRKTAYEIFMSCRSSSGGNTAGARGAAMEAAEVSSLVARPRGGGGGSRIKKALGLKARRLSSSAVAAT